MTALADKHGPKIPLKNLPGKTNWVQEGGGLPAYIERIASHVKGKNPQWSDGRCIAVAVNTVRRWASSGSVAEHGKGGGVSPATRAKAVKALAQWEAMKAAAKLHQGQSSDQRLVLLASAGREFDQTQFLLLAQQRRSAASMVRRGARGPNTKAIQARLSQLGFEVSQDGVFGPETERALREFQRSRQQKVDGLAGPKTLQALLHATPAKTEVSGADTGIDSIVDTGKAQPSAKPGRGAARGTGVGRTGATTPRIDPSTGKPIATSATGPIGSTEPFNPQTASYDRKFGTGNTGTGGQPSNQEFERKHKRGRGGQFVSTGSKGDSVQSAQQGFNRLGTKPQIVEDGQFGQQTDRAARRFQRANGLAVDGVVGPKTRRELDRQTALLRKRGTKFNT